MENIKSQAMQKKAKQFIPGRSGLLSKRPDMFSLGVWPAYYSKAEGVKVWDLDGNEYIGSYSINPSAPHLSHFNITGFFVIFANIGCLQL